MKKMPMSNSVSREIEAIKEQERDTTLYNEDRVMMNFDDNIFKALRKMLVKITKATK